MESFFEHAESQFTSTETRLSLAKDDPGIRAALHKGYGIQDEQGTMTHESLLEIERLVSRYGLGPEEAFNIVVDYWNERNTDG